MRIMHCITIVWLYIIFKLESRRVVRLDALDVIRSNILWTKKITILREEGFSIMM